MVETGGIESPVGSLNGAKWDFGQHHDAYHSHPDSFGLFHPPGGSSHPKRITFCRCHGKARKRAGFPRSSDKTPALPVQKGGSPLVGFMEYFFSNRSRDLLGTPKASHMCPLSCYPITPRPSSREVRTKVPFFSVVFLIGNPPNKSVKGRYWGT